MEILESKDIINKNYERHLAGIGPGGYCVCPDCGEKVADKIGVPCFNVKCPRCGAVMYRE